MLTAPHSSIASETLDTDHNEEQEPLGEERGDCGGGHNEGIPI